LSYSPKKIFSKNNIITNTLEKLKQFSK